MAEKVPGKGMRLDSGNEGALFGPYKGAYQFKFTLNEAGEEPVVTELCVSAEALAAVVDLGIMAINSR